jgi:membrane protein insertase Oxa1/YidC/SpoIIIJ
MNATIHSLITRIQPWMDSVRTKHGVNPILFLVLMVLCAPFFYYSIYRLIRAGVKKDKGALTLWSTIFLVSTVLPYLYVLFFGHSLPWYVYLILAVLIGHSIWSLVKKLKKPKHQGSI